jgi:CheY-like chemotaxis protein
MSSVEPRAGSFGVLVVDDEPLVRRLLNLSLTRLGYTVWEAASGEEALRLYREHQDQIGVVLLDVRMPGLDGPQTLARLRVEDPELPCYFITGDTGPYNPDTLRKCGARGIFQKPFHLGDVVQELQRLPSRCAAPS